MLVSQTNTTSYLYGGEHFDNDTKRLYLRARHLNLHDGRFMSRDRFEGLSEDASTLHPYQYAAGAPTQFSDPSGYFFTVADASITSSIQSVVSGLQIRVGFGFLSLSESSGDPKTATNDLILSAVFDALPIAGPLFGRGIKFASKILAKTKGATRKAGWLVAHEVAGGHLILKHVGQSYAQMSYRISRGAQRVSSFDDLLQAEKLVAQTLSKNDELISAWIKNSNGTRTLEVISHFGERTGRGLARGATELADDLGVLVVLERVGDKVRILTGYPIP